jgi:KDO2-lipid IV(A) lauroyltransferase
MILIYYGWRAGSFLVGHLPLSVCYRFAGLLGSALYWLMPRARGGAAANYARVMGKPPDDPAVRAAVRRAMRNFCFYALEVMRFPYLTASELSRRVVLHDTAEFNAALARQRGVIFVSIHFGNMELAGVKLARQYAPLTLPAEVMRPPQLFEWLLKARKRYGVTLVPYKHAARAIVTALKRNEFLGMFVDLGTRYDHKSVPVRFFGATTYFPAAPALVAHRTGAPIVFGYAPIDDQGTVHGYPYPVIYPQPEMARDAFVQQTMQTIASYMEDAISRYPDQWYIFRPIWPATAEVTAPQAEPAAAAAPGAGR